MDLTELRAILDTVEPSHRRVGLALNPDVGCGLAVQGSTFEIPELEVFELLTTLEREFTPRWTWWDQETPRLLAESGVCLRRCWDVVAVQRLLRGGWRWSVGSTWAAIHGLDPDDLPTLGQMDLLDPSGGQIDDDDSPVQADGHLRPEWTDSAWRRTLHNLAEWAALAVRASERQVATIDQFDDPPRVRSTAHAESAASMLCGELAISGLPFDVDHATQILEAIIGSRPESAEADERVRRQRDEQVLRHVGPDQELNLRSSDDVRRMLRRLDIDVADTRAWRLEQVRDAHPVVAALLEWRKAERLATTYGHRWLAEHVRNGRLHGEWSSSDGSAGRMTASAGLHNLPGDLRPAVVADAGHRFVRSDLGQIEPRVLAAVSGDPDFVRATASDDLYNEVAEQLGVPRATAKLAVLGAMYGATSGESANALRRLERAYPVAMHHLEVAADSGVRRVDIRTIGGRLVRLSGPSREARGLDAAREAAAARGRYARNALIQGAAAEFFKIWAVIVRSRVRDFGAEIVLCLHDELLVHSPAEHADAVASIVKHAVDEAAHHWSPVAGVRFVADVQVIERWSDAQG